MVFRQWCSTEEQLVATLSVNQLIAEINVVAKENASDVDTTERQSERLELMADNLTVIVNRFKL